MSTLDQFIESLMIEQDNLIKMGIIKGPNAHALAMHESNNTSHSKSKQKGRGKMYAEPKKEGYSKPFDDSLSSKGGKEKKRKTKCGYQNHNYHPKSACMKKQIDQMAQILHRNNLRDHITEAAKKKMEDQSK
jgi:hypothetical protein